MRLAQHHEREDSRLAPPVSPSQLGGSGTPQTLVIGDSITRNIRLEPPATVYCVPGARATDIVANLSSGVPAARLFQFFYKFFFYSVASTKAKAKAHGAYTDDRYENIVIHVGTNDVRLRQSEDTKVNIARACDLAQKMSRHRVIASGPLPVRGTDEIYSRHNHWLARFCTEQGLGFVDNWSSFWARPGLLKSDGLHPSWRGAFLLSRNTETILEQT
ncbi:uncharacterized protein [Osmerus mordax]|uniref:uncharacterized protein n=1 Tax=Osmerus mordax TaxID=8014 RepID=UPI00350F45C4